MPKLSIRDLDLTGKRVLILYEAGTRVPRLLAGLPRVTTAIYGQNTPGAIARFLLA